MTGAMEADLIQQWKEIEDLDVDEPEDLFKNKKEQWFLQAFSFLRNLPEESHCWCGHKEIMLPLLEPFYGFFQDPASNSSLRVLWRRLSKEMRECTRCIVQHHKAKEFYTSEFVEEIVKPLLDIIRVLDEERVAWEMKELVHKFNTDTLDPKQDSCAVICVMFEVLMFPFLLEDAEINETLKPFLLHVEETHDLSLAPGQRYPGAYSLLLHRDQGVRRIGLKLVHTLPTFKDEQDMESIQPMLQKCVHFLELDAFHSGAELTEKVSPLSHATPCRPRAVFTKEALWIGLTTLLSVLEPLAFMKGMMEKYPVFVSIVLNHVSEASSVFWNALRCLKLLLEVLGYKLWLGTTFSPGVMCNTLLSQCFHSHEERMHVHIFDLFQPFLQSLEALQDGEYENQRRRLLYFLLQQVPLSSNFKPLMTKKACQVAFSIIGRGYTMDPPLPPVECVHVWGPPLVATLKDVGLIASLKQSATDLIQSILVADATALASASINQAYLQSSGGMYWLESNDDDVDLSVDEKTADVGTDVGRDIKHWMSFLAVTRSVETCEQWSCVPLLWREVLTGIMPMHLPSSFMRALMWALGRLSLIDSESIVSPNNLVTPTGSVTCSRDISAAFVWVKPKGYDDGADGEGCINAVKAESYHNELVAVFKKHSEKYVSHLQHGGDKQGDWVWEPRMAEPCMLLFFDANATFREFGKEILRLTGNASTLEAGLELLCSSETSSAAVTRALQHALRLLFHWPLTQCSRGLQQLFFHAWKLLTLGDKEPERYIVPQLSQDGGFLSQPKFDDLRLEGSVPTVVSKVQKDKEAWRKLCKVIASLLWSLLEKAIIGGRPHWEGAGQLMTFTRMLQLLPCVFANLSSPQKKKLFLVGNGPNNISGANSKDLMWFQAFITWGDVQSPIIQRWWKEAVVSVMEDLKRCGLVFPSELEDIMMSLKNPGLQLDDCCRLQLSALLQSVPSLVIDQIFSDKEGDVISKKDEKFLVLRAQHSGNENGRCVLDSGMQANSVCKDFVDLTDGSPAKLHKDVLDLTDDLPVKLHKDTVDLTDEFNCNFTQSAILSRLHASKDDLLPSVQTTPGFSINRGVIAHSEHNNLLDSCISSSLSSPDQVDCEGFEKPQFRRPSVRQAATSSRSKSATLDNFLVKFYDEQAKKEGNKKVQSRTNASKPPVPNGKPQKTGSKLSSLRMEHRVDLEHRAAVEGFVRSQVRERVEKETSSNQSVVSEVRHTDNRLPKVPTVDLDPAVVTNIAEPVPRAKRPLDTILRELVSDNDADSLDTAFENVRKTRLLGMKEVVVKPKRKLITLEMPGESGRGGGLGKAQSGLIIKPRQIPRLDEWYKHILSLNYLALVGMGNENTSPGSCLGEKLEKVPLTFKSPEHYMEIFRPLVLEEFKSQLQRAHEELNFADGMTIGTLRLMSLERVDDFQVGRFMAEAGSDGAARACAENELILLSRQSIQSGPQSCHLLAKVESRDRESKSRATVLLLQLYIQGSDVRLMKAKRLLVDRSKWYMTRLMNITPQLRECQALSSLSSLPLLPVLLSPGSGLQVKRLASVPPFTSLRSIPEPLQTKLRSDHNESQLTAVAAAVGVKETMTNDHQLTLVQGPPGTGKTKTIVAILSVLLAVRSTQNPKDANENDPPLPRGSLSNGRISTVNSSSRDAAAMSRAWQDAARAKEYIKESKNYSHNVQGKKQRVLVCAQSNAAVDEIVARICKNGLYGADGSFFRPSVVRVGTLKSVHPNSLPVFIDNLVEHRLGSAKDTETDAVHDNENTRLATCRLKLEEVIEFIQMVEALRSQSEHIQEDKKVEPAESDLRTRALRIVAQGDIAITSKLNLLYRQRRELTAELANIEKEGKKAYEESKNKRKAIRKDIIRQADVLVTTLSGCGGDIYTVCMESLAGGKRNKPVQECFFDAVIIDEAAQALEPATLIPLQLLTQTNARCVMVGDPKQLPATVLSQIASRMQYECSMFERLQRAGYPVTMLSTQYRMHPEIRQFPGAHFYDDLITDGEGLAAGRKAIFHRESNFGPYVFFDVVDGHESRKGGSSSQSLSNEAEVEVALEVYLTLRKRYPAELREGRVGVITPYKQQLGRLRDQFVRTIGSKAASDLEFNTVDGFQGREVDILILSTVRASSTVSQKKDIGFVADVRRMNVALTRARFSMWIIGNTATLQANSSWASLISNAKKRSLVFTLQKPYACFFQKRIFVNTSNGNDSKILSSVTEDDKMLRTSRGNDVSGDLCRSSTDVAPESSKGYRMASEVVGSPTRISMSSEKSEGVLSKEGTERFADSNNRRLRANRVVEDELKRGFPTINGREFGVRVQGNPQFKDRASHRIERSSRVESKRPQGERDRHNFEGMSQKWEERSHESEMKRHHVEASKVRVESRAVGDSRELHREGDKHRYNERLRAERKRHYSEGQMSECSSKMRSQPLCDPVHLKHEGNSRAELRLLQEGKQEKRLGPNGDSGYRGRYAEGSLTIDHNSKSLGMCMEDSQTDRSIGDDAQDLASRQTGVPNSSMGKDGRKVPAKHGKPILKQDLVVSSAQMSKRIVKDVIGAAGNGLQVRDPSSYNQRTRKEDLATARKRQRQEVSALLSPGLLQSTKRPAQSLSLERRVSAPAYVPPDSLERSRQPSRQASTMLTGQESLDLNHEWAQFQNALREAKTGGSLGCTQIGSALRASKSSQKPVKDSKRKSSVEMEPSSDLDNILSGLSSVARAQVKGSKLEPPTKPRE